MSNIRDEIIRNAEEKMRRDAAMRRSITPDDPPRKQKRRPPQAPSEMNQISSFSFTMPPLIMKLIIFNGAAWALILYLVTGEFTFFGVGLLLIPVVIIAHLIHWIFIYIYSKFYWHITGVGWLLTTIATLVYVFYLLATRPL